VTAVPPPPAATYRLQFHAGFTFQDARRLVAYLNDLGISHIYASPYLRARSGSMHGYDVADPGSLNPELGSTEDFDGMVAELRRFGMGQLVDVVPNHMGIGDPGNYRWLDVLENGPASVYARFFDINWRPTLAQPQDHPKLVVPTLGDQYGNVLEDAELSVKYSSGEFKIAYYDQYFPIAPDTYPMLLETVLERLESELGSRNDQVQELASILTALRHLPPRRTLDERALEERNREKEIVKRRIDTLQNASAAFRERLAAELEAVNGSRQAGPSSFDRLDALLERQSYRLAFWRVAAEEINYRRFFDVTELAAVRMEDPEVFADTHKLLLCLVGEGKIHGLRIDHPDGLRDPEAYFQRLQEHCLAALDVESPPDKFYVVVEKILETGETLPAQWQVHGTTGYDFLNVLNGLFVAHANEQFFNTIYFRFLRQGAQRFKDLANSTKKMVMLISLASEINELAYILRDIARSDRRRRDFTLNSLTFVIREVIAALGIYRTYINPETGHATDADRLAIDQAVAEAKRRNPRTDPSIFDFVGDTLLLRDESSGGSRQERLLFIARFQQTTGPVMAKGTEDTAFYQFNRLISLNEVGGDPDTFGRSSAAFHRYNSERARDWPATLLASSTHDTKRSEDVRARINVLSELPRDWRAALTRWTRLNGRKKTTVQGRSAPDRNEEYLLYQTLLGAWPSEGVSDEFVNRMCEFMLKALKEAKVHTSWITPNTDYEQAVLSFTRAILDRREGAAFLDDLAALQKKVAWFGMFNSLSQTVLKLGAPGVADVYQGNELWDFSLVDPDNRRPVDFELRRQLLETIIARSGEGDRLGLTRQLLESCPDGRIKLYVSQRLLCLRRERPGLFVGGGYVPLRADPHLAAFARTSNGQTLVIVAPLLIATLMRGSLAPPIGAEVWRDQRLALPGEVGRVFEDLFTGRRLNAIERRGGADLKVAEVLADFPVAALLG
jgi:(1->4)-alpha-D-glucan 1-alpha-D-glucosylmutase